MSASGIRTPADFARAIATCDSVGCPHMAELLRPAMRGELNLVAPMRDTRMPPLHRMERHGRPVVVVVGDDDYASTGPTGWTCAVKLRSWARFAIIHGSGAQAEHYILAARMTVRMRRLLFIETSSEGAQLWAGFLRERDPVLPFMGVLPTDGAHPVMPAREAVH